jgi:HK97 family phage major capsid protein
VSIEFAEQEGAAFVSGDGVSKPRGILGYPTVLNDNYAWGKLGFVKTGAAADFVLTDPATDVSSADCLVDLYYALKAGYRNGATWLTSDKVMGRIRKMKDGNGNYLWAPPAAKAEVPTILEKPVVTDDNMPALGANKFPVAFGNFQRGYLIVDRQGVRVLRDPYTAKPNVLFYTTKRVGGGVQNFEAIKLLKCSA